MGAIPTPIKAENMANVLVEVSPKIARRVLPIKLKIKLNTNVFTGFSFTDMKIARNRIKVKAPQKTAVILAPV